MLVIVVQHIYNGKMLELINYNSSMKEILYCMYAQCINSF